MAVSYNKLRKPPIGRKVIKTDPRRTAETPPNMMIRPSKKIKISVAILDRLCAVLGANFGDIVDFIPHKDKNEKAGAENEH